MTNKTYEEFCKLGANKEFNEDYCVTLEDGSTKVVRYTDKGCDYHEDGSVNHRLFTGTIDGDKFTLVTIDTIKARLLGKAVRAKGNGTRNKQSNKPLTKEELSENVKKHVDALQNAYTNFYNLLVSWNIDTNTIKFANFDSSKHYISIARKCIDSNNELKQAQSNTAKEDVQKTLQKTGLSKAELLKMLEAMQD